MNKPEFILVEKYNITDTQDFSTCDICGQKITNVYVIIQSSNDKSFNVGSGCCKKLTNYTPTGLTRNMAEYASEIEQDEKKSKVKNWIVANNEILSKLESMSEGLTHYWPMAEEFFNNACKYGNLSEKQEAIIIKQSGKDLVNKYNYFVTCRNLGVLTFCRLAKFDKDIVHDLLHSDWGYSVRQVEMINKMINKYRVQISKDAELTKWLNREISE